MAFNEALAARVRVCLGTAPGIVEKRMFGGLAFLVHGNMSVGIHGDELIVRIEPDETDRALQEAGVRLFDITGRPMKGWLLVSSTAVERASSLRQWVGRGVAYAQALPPKKGKS
jgi:TfoX/Sxy family transcriptional regulator of competence genes